MCPTQTPEALGGLRRASGILCAPRRGGTTTEKYNVRRREYNVDGLGKLDLPPSAPEQIPFLRILVTFPGMEGIMSCKLHLSKGVTSFAQKQSSTPLSNKAQPWNANNKVRFLFACLKGLSSSLVRRWWGWKRT